MRDVLSAVLVFFCGHDPAQASALELWHHDARITTDMTLVDGAYGPNAQPFESISHETYLPRGVGLPGLAWQRFPRRALHDRAHSRAGRREPGRKQGEDASESAGDEGGDALHAPLRVNWQPDAGVDHIAGAFLPLLRRALAPETHETMRSDEQVVRLDAITADIAHAVPAFIEQFECMQHLRELSLRSLGLHRLESKPRFASICHRVFA